MKKKELIILAATIIGRSAKILRDSARDERLDTGDALEALRKIKGDAQEALRILRAKKPKRRAS